MFLEEVDFRAEDAGSRFNRSLQGSGFAVLHNHPIDRELTATIYREWSAFFDTDAKLKYEMDHDRVDGYLPPPPAVGTVRDRKELFHVYPGGRYPTEVSDAALQYFREARRLAGVLLHWIDSCADPDVTARFPVPAARMAENSEATVLRVQRYLPRPAGSPADAPWALAHTDINLLTILPTPSGPGLQVLADDTWTDVRAEPGSLVINAGEMLETVSEGAYPAALHRVVADPERADESRMSMPLFVHPADDVRVRPDQTAAQFRFSRLTELRAQNWAVVVGGASAPPVNG